MSDSSRQRRGFRGFGLRRLISSAGGVAALVVVALVVALLAGWRPSLPNPFGTKTTDRSAPAVLKSLENLHAYHAATAHIEVVVDLDKEATFLPSSLRGERTLFVGVGSVDGSVDFSKVTGTAVRVSSDRRTATITLPHAQLSQPNLDLKQSHVVARQQGLFDRLGKALGGGSNDAKLYQLASTKMTNAARADGSVLTLAEQNTTGMLKGLLGALGYTTVNVSYAGAPAR
jgi:hypothetical protein